MIDLADYYSGGYFLIRADKPDWEPLKNGLLPEKLLSLSTCICPRVCVWWGWIPGDREAPLKFGIPAEKLDEFVLWCGTEHRTEIAFSSMFFSPEAAQRFVQRFLPNTDNLYLIGTGIYKSVAETNWNHPYGGGEESSGIDERIKQRLPLAEGGIPLGFEVVCFAYSDFADSWFCNGIDEDMYELFGIRPGQFGLIQAREDAQKTCDWIMEDVGDGNHRGEPEPYAYWLLVSYPLQAETSSG